MAPDWTGHGEGGPFAVLESPEKHRFAFWKDHATPLPRELLELTRWLSSDPGRVVPEQGTDGAVRLTAASAASNVLFLKPERGPAAALWERVLVLLRTIKANQERIDYMAAEARQRLSEVDDRLREVAARVEESRPQWKEMYRRARAGRKAGHKPSRTGPAAQLRAELEKLRETQRRFETLEQERVVAARRVKFLEGEKASSLRPRPGLWGQINAFLDLQVLSAASVASEEFRKTPQLRALRLSELERQLAEE